MKKITLIGFIAALAMALVGCETTTNTNVKPANVSENTAVVVNNNTANTAVVDNNRGDDFFGDEVTREEYDRDKERYETRAREEKSTIGKGAEDLWLWTKTRSSLATTDDLRDSTINVDVENGVVTLRGTVASKAQSDRANDVARKIEGVKSVKNNLKVNPNDSVTNQTTTGNANATRNANTTTNR